MPRSTSAAVLQALSFPTVSQALEGGRSIIALVLPTFGAKPKRNLKTGLQTGKQTGRESATPPSIGATLGNTLTAYLL